MLSSLLNSCNGVLLRWTDDVAQSVVEDLTSSLLIARNSTFTYKGYSVGRYLSQVGNREQGVRYVHGIGQ